MRTLCIYLFFNIMLVAVAQRTIHLKVLNPDTFREQIKNYDLSKCDSLIMEGTVCEHDFNKLNKLNVKYLDLKQLMLSEINPLIMAHDVLLHPILSKNTQQRFHYTFKGHWRLQEIILPDSLKIIGRMCFFQCENLNKVTLPKGLLVISELAFRNCTNLENLAIPENVIAIGGSAFSGTKVWNNKKEIRLPSSLQIFEPFINIGCNAKKFTIPHENHFYSSIDGVLFDKSRLRLVRVPPRIRNQYKVPITTETLEENAFSYSSIQEIKIPERVRSIGGYCFAFCPKLKSVTLPSHDSLKLNSQLFGNCNKLRTIICKSPIPYRNGKAALNGLDKSCVIMVPKGAKVAYEQAEGWQDYAIAEW